MARTKYNDYTKSIIYPPSRIPSGGRFNPPSGGGGGLPTDGIYAIHLFDWNFNDSSGNSRDLTNAGCTFTTLSGDTSQCAVYDSSSDELTLVPSERANQSEWYISMSVRFENTFTAGNSDSIGFNLWWAGKTGSNPWDYYIRFIASTGKIQWNNEWVSPPNLDSVKSSWTGWQWYHLLFAWDSWGRKIYVDGVLNASDSVAATMFNTNQTSSVFWSWNQNTNQTTYIGERYVHNDAVTAGDVAAYYARAQETYAF